jgi:gliding motility-associated-like protein
VVVTVVPVFDLEIIASRDSFCLENNAITLTAFGAGDVYEWSTGETSPIINIHPTQTEEITLSATNNSTHCQTTASIVITRVNNPQLTVSASSDLVCENQPVTLSVITDMASTFIWNNGLTGAEFSEVPAQATTYIVTATNSFGCTATSAVSVEVEAVPTVAISASVEELCFGQASVLTATGNADSYLWSTNSTSNTIEVTPQNDTRYILTGFSEHGCSASDTVVITVHPLPTGQITASNTTLCYGDNAVLSVSGGNDCIWTAPAEIAGITLSQITITPTETTDYKVTMTSDFGCVDSLQITITVLPPQDLTLTPDTSICEGESLNLYVSGSWNYSWSNGATGNMITVSPSENTTYTVSSTAQNGCVTTASMTVTVLPTFALEITHSADTICAGDEVSLWYSGGADQYQWSTGATEQTITDGPVATTIYGLTATNDFTGCTLVRYDTVVVIPYPEFHIPDENHLICESDVIIIQAENVFNFDYLWEAVPAGSILSDPNQVFIQVSPTVPTAYICHATNHYCQMTDTVFIDIVSKPDLFVTQMVDETCEQSNGSISLHVISDYEPLTFHWSNGFETQQPEFMGIAAGIYSVTVTNAYGCSETLSDLVINNIPAPEINMISIIGSIGEEDGSIEIEVTSTFNDYTIQWYDDPNGFPLIDFTNSTYISGLNPGTYWVEVTDEACPVWASYIVPQVGVGETDIWMPNAFTPSNTDGTNQFFQLYDNGKMTFNRIIIYNRWGFPIFESTDKDFRWDGRVNGKLMTNMVFNYVIYYHDSHGNNKKYIGTVTVL